MNDEIQNPMTDDSGSNDESAALIAAQNVVNSANHHGPNYDHQQTVRERVVDEVEWRDFGDAGNDLYLFNAGEQ